jgi:hypothetical protein
MQFLSVWTRRAWDWLWLQVALALALAAAKNLSPDAQDVQLRVHAFALLFLSSALTVLGRLVCVLFFERGLLWLLVRRAVYKTLAGLAFVLFRVTSTETGKVIVFSAVLYLVGSLSYWAYVHVSIQVLKASWQFIKAVPAYLLALDLPRLAAAAESWINAWVLRDLVQFLQTQALRQKLLIQTQPLWSLAYMTVVLCCMAALWFVVERLVGGCKSFLARCAQKLDEQLREDQLRDDLAHADHADHADEKIE